MAVPTLLVEANLRKPRVASLFGVDAKAEGLVEALTHGDANRQPVTIDVVPGLSLLVAGSTAPHPQELLSSKEFLDLSQSA
jgi:Mrp family chromosome partitioning ATPase